MKKLFILLISLTSLSVFAQTNVNFGVQAQNYLNSNISTVGFNAKINIEDDEISVPISISASKEITALSAGVLFHAINNEQFKYELGAAIEMWGVRDEEAFEKKGLSTLYSNTLSLLLKNEIEYQLGKNVKVGAFINLDATNWYRAYNNEYATGDFKEEYLLKKPSATPRQVQKAFDQALSKLDKSSFGVSIKLDL